MDRSHQSEIKRILSATVGRRSAAARRGASKDDVVGSQGPMRRYVTYQGRVHNIKTAIDHLKANVVGFLVLAPLDWAKGVAPSRFNKVMRAVNIAQVEGPAGGSTHV